MSIELSVPPLWIQETQNLLYLPPSLKPFRKTHCDKKGPVSPNLNPESHQFQIWIRNPCMFEKLQKSGLKFEPQRYKKIWIWNLVQFKFWIQNLAVLKFESRIRGPFEIWIQNPWTPPYRALQNPLLTNTFIDLAMFDFFIPPSSDTPEILWCPVKIDSKSLWSP